MKNEIRTICYNKNLNIEAYQFKNIVQNFPNHFHEYYVIGFVENGKRNVSCKNRKYIVENDALILFNPYDNHTCQSADGKPFDYCGINIMPENMIKLCKKIKGKEYIPCFKHSIIPKSKFNIKLKKVHYNIMKEENDINKEDQFLLFLEELIDNYTEQKEDTELYNIKIQIKKACSYLKENYYKNISLDYLSNLTGLSKYHFLRSFTKEKGISPHCYLETLRIEKSKQLLKNGVSPLDTALQTGFSDQSHFTNSFKKLTGVTPKQYMRIFNNI